MLTSTDATNVEENYAVNLCALIGHLYVRKLLATKVLAQVVHDLVGITSAPPSAENMHLACMMLLIIGPVLDQHRNQGATLLTQFLARLSNLAGHVDKQNTRPFYEQPTRCAVKHVHETRFRQWPVRASSCILFQLNLQEEALLAVRVATTGRLCAVLEEGLLAEQENAIKIKEAISRHTGIHPRRAMVLLPDGETLLQP